MALLTCEFFSESLRMGVSVTVVLPQPAAGRIGLSGRTVDSAPPLLYLLHGLSDDHSAWTRYTSIERYADARGLAVVMPSAEHSFYRDEANGLRYGSFIAEELPRTVQSLFRVTDDPARTFIAGLSMGGYGALRIGLQHPERFGGIASLSGALDLPALMRLPDLIELSDRVFGPDGPGPDDDLLIALERAAASGATIPPLYISCGEEEDDLLGANVRFADAARTAGVPVTVDLRPGEHEWGLWDAVIPDVIGWLPLD